MIRKVYMFVRFVFGWTLAITDLAWPPVPPVRFSSLPIRGTLTADGADESNLEASCNMAQVFEIPMGSRIAAN